MNIILPGNVSFWAKAHKKYCGYKAICNLFGTEVCSEADVDALIQNLSMKQGYEGKGEVPVEGKSFQFGIVGQGSLHAHVVNAIIMKYTNYYPIRVNGNKSAEEAFHFIETNKEYKFFIVLGWSSDGNPDGHYIAIKENFIYNDVSVKARKSCNRLPLTVDNLKKGLFNNKTLIRLYAIVPKPGMDLERTASSVRNFKRRQRFRNTKLKRQCTSSELVI